MMPYLYPWEWHSLGLRGSRRQRKCACRCLCRSRFGSTGIEFLTLVSHLGLRGLDIDIEYISPFISNVWTHHTHKDEEEESLKGVKNREQNLESLAQSCGGEGEYGEKPSQSKEKHHSSNAEDQTQWLFLAHRLLLQRGRTFNVFHKNNNDTHEHDSIEDYDGKKGSKEGTPERSTMWQKTAVW